jgi:hypothetical protein
MAFDSKLIELNLKADLVDVVSDTLIYEGFFLPGKSGYTDPVCKIVRRQQTGTVWATMYADGDENYDNVWNNRAALSYSHLI